MYLVFGKTAMIFTEKHIDKRKINSLVGEPIAVDFKNPKTIGSPGLFLKAFISKEKRSDNIKANSKCNIERRPKGILLYANNSNKRTLMAIPKKELIEIKIIRGEENIKPFFLSPMWILLKLGVSVLYARYFGFRGSEYAIDKMRLEIETDDYKLQCIANGYLFERHLSFLQSLHYGEKLKVEL